MQARTLWLVLEYMERAFIETELPTKYRLLVNALRNAQGRNPIPAEIQVALRNARQALTDAHLQIEPRGFRPSEMTLYGQLGGTAMLGRGALDHLNGIFDDNIGHFANIANALEQRAAAVEALRDHCSWLLAALRQTVRQPVPEGTVPVTIFFGGDSAVDALDELGGVADEWTAIAASLAKLVGDPPDAPRILSMERGSLSLTLALRGGAPDKGGGSAGALCSAYRLCAESCLVKRQGERAIFEMESIGVGADSVRAGLVTNLAKMRDEIVDRLVGQYRPEGVGGELRGELTKAMARLSTQVDRGARLSIPALGAASEFDAVRRELDEINDRARALDGWDAERAGLEKARAEKPLETKPPVVEAKPVETKPPVVEAKPVEAKPPVVEAKPVEAKPPVVEAKPVETKPPVVEAKPVEAKPVETKPVETKAVETKPVETKPVETKAVPPPPPRGERQGKGRGGASSGEKSPPRSPDKAEPPKAG